MYLWSTLLGAFAALKTDGSVVTWGGFCLGGDSSSVSLLSSGVSVSTLLLWPLQL